MEKRLNKKVEEYLTLFKDNIKTRTQELNLKDIEPLIQYIYDYERLVFEKDDLAKRKRVKNIVPYFERCNAKRANGHQCTRRKRNEMDCCGTHSKGSPHGYFQLDPPKEETKTTEVFVRDIKGIMYYIDNANNVYDTEDVLSNRENPRVIAKFEKHDDVYSIPEFNI